MNWQTEWRERLSTANDLAQAGLIPLEQVESYERVLAKYQLALPRYYASLINPSDPNCPIRRQAVPSLEELSAEAEAQPDPLADLAHRPSPRITHRYPNRALLHLTPNCSMYCRYCFRKTLLNEWSGELFSGSVEEAVAYIVSSPRIEEVILSGGDPLMLTDTALSATLKRLAEIPHVRRLRIHTRVPVTLPSRITAELVRGMQGLSVPLVMVTHFNHPKELTPQALQAVRQLRDAATMLNQSVLLKGVNADVDTLVHLSTHLFEGGGILPYYLHHPDPASGTALFHLSMPDGIALYTEVKRRLPGYLVPKYVVDIVGEDSKQSVEDYFRRRLL